MGFFECDQGISGQALANKITSCLHTYRFGRVQSARPGIRCTVAGNMAGSVNGTAALMAL